MPAGRPSKYTKDMCEVAERVLGEGYSQEVLAGELGVIPETVSEWKKEHPEFSVAIKKGKIAGQKMWERLGLAGAAGKVVGFNSASWIFNMKNRYGWRDKVEHTGEDGGPIVVQVVKHSEE